MTFQGILLFLLFLDTFHIQGDLSFPLFPDTFRIQKCVETGKRQNPLHEQKRDSSGAPNDLLDV